MYPILLAWCTVALALLGHGMLWTGVVNRLHGLGGPRKIIKALTLICIAAFVILLVMAIGKFVRTGALLNEANLVGMGGYVWFCAAVGLAALVVKPWIEHHRYDRATLVDWKTDRRDPVKSLGSAPLHGRYARFLGQLPGNEALQLSIERKALVLPRLPAELEGLTIVHLSDLHLTGRIGEEYFSYLADQVNNLRPDVIAVTGDIIEHEACWPWLQTSLGRLCAPLGLYYILGNHDAFIDVDKTRRLLVDAGFTSLSGRWLRAEWNGESVLLGGNELPWMKPAASLAELPPRRANEPGFRLALCHSPDQFSWCCRADVDLALAGHTHGGQVQFPVLGMVTSPSLHGARYACGVFRRGHTVLHVSRGIGGETPLRWRCPPELALLELKRGQA